MTAITTAVLGMGLVYRYQCPSPIHRLAVSRSRRFLCLL